MNSESHSKPPPSPLVHEEVVVGTTHVQGAEGKPPPMPPPCGRSAARRRQELAPPGRPSQVGKTELESAALPGGSKVKRGGKTKTNAKRCKPPWRGTPDGLKPVPPSERGQSQGRSRSVVPQHIKDAVAAAQPKTLREKFALTKKLAEEANVTLQQSSSAHARARKMAEGRRLLGIERTLGISGQIDDLHILQAMEVLDGALSAVRPIVVGHGESARLEMVPDWQTRAWAAEFIRNTTEGLPIKRAMTAARKFVSLDELESIMQSLPSVKRDAEKRGLSHDSPDANPSQ